MLISVNDSGVGGGNSLSHLVGGWMSILCTQVGGVDVY